MTISQQQEIRIGRRILDIHISRLCQATRDISWRVIYERELNDKNKLVGCGFYQPTLEKIVREEGALIEAALWEIIDRKEIQQ